MNAAYLSPALQALGGVGLFLLGMTLLTEGLRALAGDSLRGMLGRFTRSPLSGVAAGAAATAVVQSSSAITVMTVGFVGAGLLTFPQALGVIMGANLGTTATGWLVAVLGFKLNLGLAALGLLPVGVLARMFGRGRWRDAGWALAGFALIFIGIDALQGGMAAFEGAVTPATFPPDTGGGRALLVAIGAAVSAVTQSSSAGLVTAMAALEAGAISYHQAAAMVIGMNLGTTATVLLASVGGSAAMRQTALGHVLFNLTTGAVALAVLDPFTAAISMLTAEEGVGDPQLALVAFHTAFNLLGVALILPVAGRFARAVQRLAPERRGALAERLDPALLSDPNAAADAAAAGLATVAEALFAAQARALNPDHPPGVDADLLAQVDQALAAAQDYLDRIAPPGDGAAAQARKAALLHALDHLRRLAQRCRQGARSAVLRRDPRLRRMARALRLALAPPAPGAGRAQSARLERFATLAARWSEPYRQRVLARAAAGAFSADEAARRLDAHRWARRSALHASRIVHHLRAAAEVGPAPQAPPQSHPADF